MEGHDHQSLLSTGTTAKSKKSTQAAHEDFEKALLKWFLDMRAKKMPICGTVLQQTALDYACMLDIDDFKASTDWLTRFKARHDIVTKVLCGESAASDANSAVTCASSALPEIMKKYASFDVYNADETGLFYQVLPTDAGHERPTMQRREVQQKACDSASVHQHGSRGVQRRVDNEEIRHNESSDDKNDAQDASAPHPALDVMDAFDVIRNFFRTHDDVAMQLLTEYKHRTMALMAKRQRQSKMTELFWK